jgi:hypothetical protein
VSNSADVVYTQPCSMQWNHSQGFGRLPCNNQYCLEDIPSSPRVCVPGVEESSRIFVPKYRFIFLYDSFFGLYS